MQAFYADHFVLQLPEGHRFPMQKYRMLRERVAKELPGIRLEQALAASEGELALAHTPHYIAAVLQGHLSTAQQREIESTQPGQGLGVVAIALAVAP